MNSEGGCKWYWNGFCVNEDCILYADWCPFNSEEAQEKLCMVSKELFGFEQSVYVIVDKTTRVMYWLSHGINNYGTLTMLVNPDGTPRIWEG